MLAVTYLAANAYVAPLAPNLVRPAVSPRFVNVAQPIAHGGNMRMPTLAAITSKTERLPEPTMTVARGDDKVKDALAGLAVAFSLLSKAIACSALIGVSPLVGIWSSVIMGVTAPLLGSRPGVISGAAAVVAVPIAALANAHGIAYIPVTIMIAAVLEGLFGIFKLSRFSALISSAVMAGFLNALGVILAQSQLKIFTSAAAFGPAVAAASICFSITQWLPKITTAIPSSLAGLVAATATAKALQWPLKTLADTAGAATFAGGMASLPQLTDFGAAAAVATSPAALKFVLPAAISIAFISIIETLLSGRVVDDLKNEKLCTFNEDGEIECMLPTGDVDLVTGVDYPTQSVLAMSVGKGISAIFGGFGGCGLIPQTVLNIKSGGGGPLSSAAYAISMIMFVLFAAPLVGQISLAALAGIMFCVSFDTIQWGATFGAAKAAIKKSGKGVRSELAGLAVAMYICYTGDMAVGISAGVIVEKALKRFGLKRAEMKAQGKGAVVPTVKTAATDSEDGDGVAKAAPQTA